MATNPQNLETASKRWIHFHSALQLAIQRVANKWTFDDFAECFPQYCEEQLEVASGLHTTLARHMEASISAECDILLASYSAQEKVDILHTVVTEARARRHSTEVRKDLWREDLQPRAAVRARTIPVLEGEVKKLKATLEELENRNLKLQTQMQANVQARKEADDKVAKMLDALDEVYRRWSQLPLEQIQEWALHTAEITSGMRPR